VSCVAAERIYAYLDGDLAETERLAFEAHLAECGACRTAVARRRLIAEAAKALPPLAIPDGFAAAIVARLPRERARAAARKPVWRRPGAWAAAAGALALLAAAGAGALVLTGTSVPDLVPTAIRYAWDGVRELAALLAKAAGYTAVAVKVAGQVATQLLNGFRVLSSFIGPEARLAGLIAALMMGGAGFALWRRRSPMEDSHES
jgi:anti-sigma factor RsiW